jgi:hypothetical protein
MAQLALCRKLALLVLALALLTPWPAQAFPLGSSPAEPLAGFVARLTGWFTAWFGDVGCSMDPSDRCHAATTDRLDIGCSMDPDGRCKATLTDQIEVGCSWAPNGGSCPD